MRRFLLFLVGVTALMAVLIPVAGLSNDFIMIPDNQPSNIDPAKVSDNPDSEVARLLYEALVEVDPATALPAPVLATSWSASPDKKDWTFNLRPNVKFHDGSDFDATDVATCVTRALAIGAGESYLLTDIDSVEVVNDLAVVFHLKASAPDFVYALARMFIPSAEAVAAHDVGGDLAQAWFAEHAAGTGAYKFASWTRGVEIVAERFQDYWKGWQAYKNIDRIVLRVVPEPGTQALVMTRGEGNFATTVPMDEALRMESNPALRVESYSGDPGYFVINPNRGPLANRLVRMALAHCFDVQAFIDDALMGFGTPLTGPVPGDFFGANNDLQGYSFDLALARELLAQAGYPGGGFELEFTYDSPITFKGLAALQLQENLKKVGIKLNITALTWLPWQARIVNPEERPDIGFLYLLGSDPIPYSILSPMYEQKSQGHWAYWGYENDGFDQLLEKAKNTLNDEERAQLYSIAQAIVFDDVASIPIMEWPQILVFSSNVKGFVYSRYWPAVPNYYDLWLEE
jgi:peptide/nickel transport system substrate-binding protein